MVDFEDRLRARSRWRAEAPLPEHFDLPFSAWTQNLMAGAATARTSRSLDRLKLRLTEGYREALRQVPGEQVVLFDIWDAAYRILEHLHWELAPPVLDPPPPLAPLSFEEVRRQYKAMKRERARHADAQRIHWHPMEISNHPHAQDSPAGVSDE